MNSGRVNAANGRALLIATTIAILGSTAFVLAAPIAPAIPRGAIERASPLVEVRDVCGVRYEGRTKITSYCDDPMVCDAANPGKCKPGPELQRKLDRERREREAELKREEEELKKMERDLSTKIRQLRQAERQAFAPRRNPNSYFDDRRATGGCKTTTIQGQLARICPGDANRMSDNVYDPKRIPSPQYGRARHTDMRRNYGNPQRVSGGGVRTTPTLRTRLKFGFQVKPLVDYHRSMQSGDPARAGVADLIRTIANTYADQGLDADKEVANLDLDYVRDSAKPITPATSTPNVNIPSATTPQPSVTAPQPAVPQPTISQPAKPRISEKDEALCSYLMTLEQDKLDERGAIQRYGQEIPNFCKPYLQSIGRNEPRPQPYRTNMRAEDLEEIKKLVDEASSLLPPDYGK